MENKGMQRGRFLQSAGVASTVAAVSLTSRAVAAAAEVPSENASVSAAAFDPAKFVVMHQLVQAAHDQMKVTAWNYLLGCADTETTMRRNRYALDAVAFKPRALRGVGTVDMTSQFLGKKLRLPVIMSGIGSVALIDPGGAATVAAAASKFGVGMGYSSVASPSLERVAAAGNCPKVVQLYAFGDDDWVDAYAARAIAAGFDAFGFTIDSAHFSRRERDIMHAGNNSGLSDTALGQLANLTWDKIKRFKQKHQNVSVAVKGITTGEDAELAVQAGCSIVWVSTHGGRQCDYGRGAYDVLPEVVQAVKGKATIIFDSGVYRGSDVIKALAAGADLVGIGRLYCYGLANGEAGVVRVLELLEREMEASMSNLGAHNIAALNQKILAPGAVVSQPGLFSAFPLMDSTGFSKV